MIGNRLFQVQTSASPRWVLGFPSLWVWQMLWWALGVLLIWCLAYLLGLSMPPARRTEFDRDRALERFAQHRRPGWITTSLDRVG